MWWSFLNGSDDFSRLGPPDSWRMPLTARTGRYYHSKSGSGLKAEQKNPHAKTLRSKDTKDFWLFELLWGNSWLQLLDILCFGSYLLYAEIRTEAQNDKRGDPTIPQRAGLPYRLSSLASLRDYLFRWASSFAQAGMLVPSNDHYTYYINERRIKQDVIQKKPPGLGGLINRFIHSVSLLVNASHVKITAYL